MSDGVGCPVYMECKKQSKLNAMGRVISWWIILKSDWKCNFHRLVVGNKCVRQWFVASKRTMYIAEKCIKGTCDWNCLQQNFTLRKLRQSFADCNTLKCPTRQRNIMGLTDRNWSKNIDLSELRGCVKVEVVCKSRWPSWAPVPYKPTVSVDVKQHFNKNI